MASNKFRRGRLNSFSISFSDDILPHLAQTANIMMELEGETKKRKFNGGEFSLTAVDNDTVEIRFGKTDNQKKYRLFEVSKQLLAEVVGAGCRLVGDNTVDVVLCTSSKTYSIKKVEISNSVYLVPPSLDPNIFCVQNPHREYYEVCSRSEDIILSRCHQLYLDSIN